MIILNYLIFKGLLKIPFLSKKLLFDEKKFLPINLFAASHFPIKKI